MRDTRAERYLLLFKLDAKNLFYRIKERKAEYIDIFAMKRSREHFAEIFWTRYDHATVHDLANCEAETIMAMDRFYSEVDEIRWYLNHTEDMPKTVSDVLDKKVHELEQSYESMQLFIDAELGIGIDEEQESPAFFSEAPFSSDQDTDTLE